MFSSHGVVFYLGNRGVEIKALFIYWNAPNILICKLLPP